MLLLLAAKAAAGAALYCPSLPAAAGPHSFLPTCSCCVHPFPCPPRSNNVLILMTGVFSRI